MGDSDFLPQHLPTWKKAESFLNIANAAPKAKPKPTPATHTPADVYARVPPSYDVPCANYRGFRNGFVFNLGLDTLIGYNADRPQKLLLDLVIPPRPEPACDVRISIDLATLTSDQPQARRARRQREKNGKRRHRKRRGRRQRAIDAHPDNHDKKPAYTTEPTAVLGERWWPEHGLWSVLTANPNCWKAMVKEVLEISQDDFVLGQETKLQKYSTHKVAGTTARRCGWAHSIGMAHQTSGTMGSGGLWCLCAKRHRPHHGTSRHGP